ncbi:hypothetical protein TanjilG_20220 [Lupinus angustifolius]|uniref:Non-specific lipid-transfer protein n=2 Tax=Lupinus angustifolius TaxID=3871 RepID=A0A1J7HG07_LUPAN|nr:hypothetical protein TanjilG_20220 [Lupinus angustifolius]
MNLSSSTIGSLILFHLLLASPSPYCVAHIECAEIIEYLQTCVGYLKHGGASDKPPSTCCDGVKAVLNKLKSVDDKRDACNCIKAIVQITKLKLENARNVPIKCGIKIPFQISPDFDCSS